MAIGVYFSPESVNTNQYDDVIKQLNSAGASTRVVCITARLVHPTV